MKKLKDTKIGAFLKEKAPQVLDTVGDLLPDSGTLGIVKNVIDIAVPDPEEKKALLQEMKAMELEFYKVEVQDRDSARKAETERDTSEHSSWLSKNIHEIIAISFVLGWFIMMIVLINMFIAGSITMQNLTILLAATGIKDMILLILGYLYGKSKPQP